MSTKGLVYLAGPITGLSYGGCTDWREKACEELGFAGLTGLSPMRCKEYLARETVIKDHYAYEDSILSSARGIMTRDRFDCTRCDIVLMNLLGATKVSIGTMMELAWADLKRIPVVCVMEKTGNVHEHGMVTEAIGFRTETLEKGLQVVKAILIPA